MKYYRLSLEDREEGESGSITNQRRLVEGYLQGHRDLSAMESRELSDDGYTGANFNRPGIRQFFRLLGEGRVGCLVVKDFSRFTRDYIELGDYVEQVFPFMGVRFISVNDGYDSEKADAGSDWQVAWKGLMNSLYSRDISLKVKAAKRQMIKEGRICSGSYPFGYRKTGKSQGPHCQALFQVDEDAAKIVRLIFRLALEGKKNKEIARMLNQTGYPTPAMYKRQKGGFGYGLKEGEDALWDAPKVLAILRDERYAGTLIAGRYQGVGEGGAKTKKAPELMWVRKEKGMPELISREDFERVQAMRPVSVRGQYQKGRSPLYRKAKCGYCKKYLYRKVSGGGDSQASLFCQRPRLLPGAPCFGGYVKETAILDVLSAIISTSRKLAGEDERKFPAMGVGKAARHGHKGKAREDSLEKEMLAWDYKEYKEGKLTWEGLQERKLKRKEAREDKGQGRGGGQERDEGGEEGIPGIRPGQGFGAQGDKGLVRGLVEVVWVYSQNRIRVGLCYCEGFYP